MTLFDWPAGRIFRDDCRTKALRLWMQMRKGYYEHWPLEPRT